MVDQILKTLLQQRLMAAKEFLGFCPVGSYYDYNGQVCIVTGYDAKTGFLNLQPTSGGGAILNPDPISILYPNATAAATSAAAHGVTGASTGQNIVQATSGGSTSILSVAGMVGPTVAPVLINKLGKHTAPPASGNAAGTPNWDSLFKNAPDKATPPLDVSAANAKLQTDITHLDDYIKLQQDKLNALSGIQKQNDLLSGLNVDPNMSMEKFQEKMGELLNSGKPADINRAGTAINIFDQRQDLFKSLQDTNSKLTSLGASSELSNATNQLDQARAKLLSDMQQMDLNTAQNNAISDFKVGANTQADIVFSANGSGATPGGQTFIDQSTPYASFNDTQQTLFNQSYQSLVDQKVLVPYQWDAAGNRTGNFDPKQSWDNWDNWKAKQQVLDNARKNWVDSVKIPTQAQVDSIMPQAKKLAWDQMSKADQDKYGSADNLPNNDPIVKREADNLLRENSDKFTAENSTARIADLKKQEAHQLHGQELKLGFELFGSGMAAYGEERSLDALFSAKNFSWKAFAGVLGTGFGLYYALHDINKMLVSPGGDALKLLLKIKDIPYLGHLLAPFLKFISSGWGFAAIQGLIFLVAWLMHKKPSPEEVAAETLNAEVNPLVWNPNGAVIFLTAGLTMSSMGLNLSPSAPLMQTLTLTQAQATQALTNAGAGSVPTDSTRYADVFVKQGAGGQPTQVVWLTPVGRDSKGNIIEKVTVDTLNRNFQFATSQPPTGYVPFFINGANGAATLNPQVVQSLAAQQHLTQCANAPGVWVTNQVECIDSAGAARLPGGG